MTDQETWAMFAAAALCRPNYGTNDAATAADLMLAEFRKMFPEPAPAHAPEPAERRHTWAEMPDGSWVSGPFRVYSDEGGMWFIAKPSHLIAVFGSRERAIARADEFRDAVAAPAPAGVTLPPEWEVNALHRRDGVEIAKIGHNDWRVYADGQNHYLAKCESLAAALEAVAKIQVRK